jgi:hypothetical protein
VQTEVDRLLALVRRELGASEVHVLEPDGTRGEPAAEGDSGPSPDGPAGGRSAADGLAGSRSAADAEHSLRCRLPDGRGLVAIFQAPPEERETKQRRLEMLASTFEVMVEEPATKRRSRPPIARALQEELEGLCARASAANVLIVDANSPVVWGAARPKGLGAEWPIAGDASVDSAEGGASDEAAIEDSKSPVAIASRAALDTVRSMGALTALRKGRHLRHVEREAPAPFLAHSFAGIYLLVLVFDGGFDELRAERAVSESLARVEQLVLALPPLDPTPGAGAGVVAMRRPRRR